MNIFSYRHPLLVAYGNFIFRYRGRIFPIALVLALAREGFCMVLCKAINDVNSPV